MKKQTQQVLLGGAALTAIAANAYFLLANKSEPAQPTASTPDSSKSVSSTDSQASSSAIATSTSSQTKGQDGQLKDGTYTGAVTSTNRGDYQVQVTIEKGEISDIEVLLFPDDNPTSVQINDGALPTYIEAALKAQSSDIQLISGASEAFKGFTGSLQDAINQANPA